MRRLSQRRLDTSTTRRFGGSGLGLALSRDLIERMSGSIRVTSAPGRGATFEFDLALGVADAPIGGSAAVALKNSLEVSTPPACHPHVLVIDDNPVNLKVAEALLNRCGCQVETATGAVAGLSLAAQARHDLVLMDLSMPEIDGLEATRRLRALPGAQREVPVYALTAAGQPEDHAACFAAGMNGVLTKPVTLDRLRSLVRSLEPRAAG